MHTHIISSKELLRDFYGHLDSISEDSIIIIKNRGKEYAFINADILEDLLMQNDPEYLASIAKSRTSNELYTHQEVFKNL